MIAALPAADTPRLALLRQRYGYGRHAGTGADGWRVVKVRTDGELREAAATPGTWIVVQRDVHLDGGPLAVGRDVAIVGEHRGVTLTGYGLRLREAHGSVVSGLTLRVDTGDAIEVTNGTRDWWVHRCLIAGWEDGALDVVRAPGKPHDGPIGGTVSETTFTGGDKAVLIGSDDRRHADARLRVTFRGCTWTGFGRRAPRLRYAKVHMLGCLIQGWGEVGQDEATAISLTRSARLLMERCVLTAGPASGNPISVEDGSAFRRLHSTGFDQPSVDPHRVTWPTYVEDARATQLAQTREGD